MDKDHWEKYIEILNINYNSIKIYLVEKKDTKELFALKTINKKLLENKNNSKIHEIFEDRIIHHVNIYLIFELLIDS